MSRISETLRAPRPVFHARPSAFEKSHMDMIMAICVPVDPAVIRQQVHDQEVARLRAKGLPTSFMENSGRPGGRGIPKRRGGNPCVFGSGRGEKGAETAKGALHRTIVQQKTLNVKL